MSSIQVTLPDGSHREYSAPITLLAVAESIGKKLAEASVAAKVDGKIVDLMYSLNQDASVALITKDSKEGVEVIRHSTAHLLAHAVKELYPGTQITIGPVIEDGFYYDIDCPVQLTPEDLPKIEKRMQEIISRKLPVARKELKPQEAIDLFNGIGDHYKVELINGFPAGEVVSAYSQGEFIDLCRGPHVPNTDRLGVFKLLSIAGAYWRGDERNKMLQRIYGTAFGNKKDLQEHLTILEEAKKRDHRKVGPELGIFTFLPIATAMPFYLPKGTVLFNLLVEYMRRDTQRMGYQEVICPQLMTSELWKTSGHWDNYRDNMYSIDNEEMSVALKPMNCPGHAALFGSTRHSYRELPIRFTEYSRLHRYERGGVTHGLLRTRCFSQDDGHVFCTEDQVPEETRVMIKHIYETYKVFGFGEVIVKLATRPEKSIGTAESWEKSINVLAQSLKDNDIPFEWAHGEGAFYGPKIEFHIKDSLKRTWQCGTIQLDPNLPERFKLEYIDNESKAQRPIMIHRAVLGSVERFMGILIEHHSGHLPLWIAPTQAVVINVTDAQLPYCKEVAATLQAQGYRVETDFRNEKLGYKIREAQMQKIPLMIVVGNNEMEKKTISVRKVTGESLNDLTLEKFAETFKPQLGGTHH